MARRERARTSAPAAPAAQIDNILDILPPPLEWVQIPAGRVTLAKGGGTFDVQPFYMGKYTITYAQFQAFIDAPVTPCHSNDSQVRMGGAKAANGRMTV
jgi:formylglycine-generating enzyme required for sulfatase activity